MIELDAACVAYAGRTVVGPVSLQICPGEIVSLVGPNGSGKSSLMRAIAGLHPAAAGRVRVRGEDPARMPRREAARLIGFLPQQPGAPEEMTVRRLVWQGRHPHRRRWHAPSPDDRTAVEDAMRLTGVLAYAERPLGALSGGERQRAWLAVAIAQHTPIVMLDEPTSFLDVVHQIELLELVRDLNRSRGATIVLVLHDLALALRYSDRIIVLADGGVRLDGTPDRIGADPAFGDAFGVDLALVRDPDRGGLACVPYLSQTAHPGGDQGTPADSHVP